MAESESGVVNGTVPRSLLRKASALSLGMQNRDTYTAGHQRRVALLAFAIAQEMGLPRQLMDQVHIAGLVHDVGKLYLPPDILAKPGCLTDKQKTMIMAHPRAGYQSLSALGFPRRVAEIVLQHHERMDGSGYPSALTGPDILLAARIVAVADVVEAAASDRPYRRAQSPDDILDEVLQDQGLLYDPRAVDAVRELITSKGYALGGAQDIDLVEPQVRLEMGASKLTRVWTGPAGQPEEGLASQSVPSDGEDCTSHRQSAFPVGDRPATIRGFQAT